jgi:hypothetical protein
LIHLPISSEILPGQGLAVPCDKLNPLQPDWRYHLSAFGASRSVLCSETQLSAMLTQGKYQTIVTMIREDINRWKQTVLEVVEHGHPDFLLAGLPAALWAWKLYVDKVIKGTTPCEQEGVDLIRNTYRYLDRILEELFSQISSQNIMIVSEGIKEDLSWRSNFINALLMDQGFILGLDNQRESLLDCVLAMGIDVEWSDAHVYCVGDGVYINRTSLELQGESSEKRFRAFTTELKSFLLKVTHPESGELLIDSVIVGRDIFDGPFVHLGPELVIKWRSSELSCTGEKKLISGSNALPMKGLHADSGVVLVSGEILVTGTSRGHVLDIAPTILHAMGVRIPEYFEGQVLDTVFEPTWSALNPVFTDRQATLTNQQREPSNRHRVDLLEDRLKGLGYIE